MKEPGPVTSLGLTKVMVTEADRTAGWDFHSPASLSVDYYELWIERPGGTAEQRKQMGPALHSLQYKRARKAHGGRRHNIEKIKYCKQSGGSKQGHCPGFFFFFCSGLALVRKGLATQGENEV